MIVLYMYVSSACKYKPIPCVVIFTIYGHLFTITLIPIVWGRSNGMVFFFKVYHNSPPHVLVTKNVKKKKLKEKRGITFRSTVHILNVCLYFSYDFQLQGSSVCIVCAPPSLTRYNRTNLCIVMIVIVVQCCCCCCCRFFLVTPFKQFLNSDGVVLASVVADTLWNGTDVNFYET